MARTTAEIHNKTSLSLSRDRDGWMGTQHATTTVVQQVALYGNRATDNHQGYTSVNGKCPLVTLIYVHMHIVC